MSDPKMVMLSIDNVREIIECVEEVVSEYRTSNQRQEIIEKMSSLRTGDVVYIWNKH